jgi:hypothetical protein
LNVDEGSGVSTCGRCVVHTDSYPGEARLDERAGIFQMCSSSSSYRAK